MGWKKACQGMACFVADEVGMELSNTFPLLALLPHARGPAWYSGSTTQSPDNRTVQWFNQLALDTKKPEVKDSGLESWHGKCAESARQ